MGVKPARQTKGVRAPVAEPADISNEEADELVRIREELENMPYTPRSYREKEKGGGLDVTAGAAGAPVYDDIVGTAFRQLLQRPADIAIIERWRTRDHRYFKINTSEGHSCVLRQDVTSGAWEVSEEG